MIKLVVGLGNIGLEYVNTRHNIGFKVVDLLARKESLDFQTVKLGSIAEYKTKGRTLLLLKPNTYMNLSGKAVQYWMEKEKIEKDKRVISFRCLSFDQVSLITLWTRYAYTLIGLLIFIF